MVVQRGLRRVDKVDGGLTRARWEAKRGAAHAHARKPPKTNVREIAVKGGDGAGSEVSDISTECHAPFETAIWVDIFDPINNPSFKPNPLKPIPLFMQRAPALALEGKRQPSAIDAYLQTPSPLQGRGSSTYTICPTPSASAILTSRAATPRHATSRPTTPRLTAAQPPTLRYSNPQSTSSRAPIPVTYNTQSPILPQEYLDDVGPLPLEPRRQPFSVVREEPLKRPSSRLAPHPRRGEERSSAYQTSPGYTEELSQMPYQRPLSTARAASPLSSKLMPQLQRVVRSAPPQSSEYLERYRPVMAVGSRKPPSLTEPRPRPAIPVVSLPERSGYGKALDEYGGNKASNEGRDWGKVKTVGAELRRFFMGW